MKSCKKEPDLVWERGYCRGADRELHHYFHGLVTEDQSPVVGVNPLCPQFRVHVTITGVAEIYSDREEDCGKFLGHLRLENAPEVNFRITFPYFRHITHNSRGDLHFWCPSGREVYVFLFRKWGSEGQPLFDPPEIHPLASTATLAVCCGSDDHLWQVSSTGNFYHYAPDCSLLEKISVQRCTIKGNFSVDENWNITYQNGNRRYLATRNN